MRIAYSVLSASPILLFIGALYGAKALLKPQLTADYGWAIDGLDLLLQIALLPLSGALVRGWQRYPRLAFIRVFGQSIATSEYAISTPEFAVSEDVDRLLISNGFENSRKRFTPIGVDRKFVAGDINRIIASSDIVGSAYLIDGLGRFTDAGPRFEFGADLFERNVSFLSIGLQTNAHSPQFANLVTLAEKKTLLRSHAGLTARHPEIAHKIAGVQELQGLIIEPNQAFRSADLVIEADGTEHRVTQSHDVNWNVGVIIIARNPRRRAEDIRWIACAGVGHGGTSGSGYYLAHYWRNYAKHFGLFGMDAVLSITLTEMRSAPYQDQQKALDAGTIELCRVGLRGIG